MQTRIDTPRLTLEPLDDSHADALYAVYQDPDVSRLLFTKAGSRDEFREVHRRSVAFGESHGMWAVRPRGDSTLIGRIGFFAFGEARRPELAFLLASTAWGRGHATEACRAVLQHARHARGWPEVVAVVRPANAPAIRVLQKLGFSLEAELQVKGMDAALFAYRLAQAAHPGAENLG